MLAYHDISLLLLIDVSTFFVTITTTFIVRRGIKAKQPTEKQSFLESMKEGWRAIHIEKGVFVLVLCSSLITLFLGTLQILVEPMILSFSDSKVLGIVETLCASGMLVSGILLGGFGIKKEYGKVLQISFFMAGIFMIGMSIFENLVSISIFGFFFFATLPLCNNCMDYLCRTNIPDALQGRAWGFIGFLSQMGYVLAYAVSGLAADSLGSLSGMGVGRGAAMMIGISGVFLSLVAVTFLHFPSIRELEKRTE